MAKPKVKQSVRRETEQRLARLARAGEVLIDGEAFKGIVLTPALNTGDDYMVDHDKFLSVKKTLLNLKRLDDGDVGVIAWRPFGQDQADIVVPVDLYCKPVRPGNHPLTDAMRRAFAGETATQEIEINGQPVLSICGPIRDSMEQVVGVVEIYASLAPDKFRVDQFGQ